MRLLFVVAAAFALWWLYGTYSDRAPEVVAPAAAASGSGAGTSASAPASTMQAPLQAPGAQVVESATTLAAATAADALAAGRLADVPQPFVLLQSAAGVERERLAAALIATADRAEPSAGVQLLAGHNAFLQTEEGRRIGQRILDKVTATEPTVRVELLSRLLEACMRGPIEKTDTEAHAFADEVWRRQQVVLRQTVLDPAKLTGARSYTVRPGDVLDRIARKFRDDGCLVEAWTLAAFNRIDDPGRLRAGQVLKVPVDPIRTVVEKNSFLMAVYVGDVIFRLYWIGHGADDRTPEATFRVVAKQEHPDWYAPDGRVIPYGSPENVLGDYFVKFEHPSYTGFGCHGTSQPESICTRASAGCIRMHDADIEDFFRIVPRGTEVEIRASR